MNAIRATWKNGQIVPENPVDWPEGLRLLIEPDPSQPEGDGACDDDWSNSPEAIADWLKWYDSLEPLIFTAEEEADTEAWLKKMNEYEIAKMNKGIEELFR